MEDAQRTYDHEDEAIRMYYNIGDEGTHSNGHGECNVPDNQPHGRATLLRRNILKHI